MGDTIRADEAGNSARPSGPTTGFNETVEVNRTTWNTFPVTLADGQNWTRPYTFRINATGLWKLEFLLYKNGVLTSQKLRLYVRVS